MERPKTLPLLCETCSKEPHDLTSCLGGDCSCWCRLPDAAKEDDGDDRVTVSRRWLNAYRDRIRAGTRMTVLMDAGAELLTLSGRHFTMHDDAAARALREHAQRLMEQGSTEAKAARDEAEARLQELLAEGPGE